LYLSIALAGLRLRNSDRGVGGVSTEQNIIINTNSLPEGVYVCAIEKAGKTMVEKFIKK